MSQKRPLQNGQGQHFSCDLCYRKKVKCDRGNPCTSCVRHKVKCIPSPVETSDRPRKRRYPEAELLGRIRKYEAALVAYGADLESIRSSDGDQTLPSTSTPKEEVAANPHYEFDHLQTILQGDKPVDSSHKAPAKDTFFDDMFEDDGSSLLFAVEPDEMPSHPPPFDIFKLWQIYCDNIHPLNKTLHSPTFQRKISAHGPNLQIAPAVDQALFFAVYSAAITSLTAEECEATFFAPRKLLLERYQQAAQMWLRRAGLWRTSELSVLQAFILLLFTLQGVVDQRVLASFTAVADRIARRMRIHCDTTQGISSVEQEMRRRLWWELVLLDARTLEKAGMGTSVLASNWIVGLPSERSDADLECLDQSQPPLSSQPSSDMIFFLIRAEVACFLATLRSQQGMQAGYTEFSTMQLTLAKKLQMISDLETRLSSKYLKYCDIALFHHRLTTTFTQHTISRMRIAAYIAEEASKDKSQRATLQIDLLELCIIALDGINKVFGDPGLHRFEWFMLQNFPFIPFVHLLRLLLTHITGHLVDRAWQALQTFISFAITKAENGRTNVAQKGWPWDSLILRAWVARKIALPYIVEDPGFIKDIRARVAPLGEAMAQSNGWDSRNAKAGHDADPVSLLAKMVGQVDHDFDWSTWLEQL